MFPFEMDYVSSLVRLFIHLDDRLAFQHFTANGIVDFGAGLHTMRFQFTGVHFIASPNWINQNWLPAIWWESARLLKSLSEWRKTANGPQSAKIKMENPGNNRNEQTKKRPPKILKNVSILPLASVLKSRWKRWNSIRNRIKIHSCYLYNASPTMANNCFSDFHFKFSFCTEFFVPLVPASVVRMHFSLQQQSSHSIALGIGTDSLALALFLPNCFRCIQFFLFYVASTSTRNCIAQVLLAGVIVLTIRMCALYRAPQY